MHSLSLSSPQQQQPRTIWFQLIDHSGNSYKQAAISDVKLPPDSNVADFLNAIEAENPSIFSSIDMLEAKVYKSKDSFKDWEFPLSVNELEGLLRYEVIPAEVDALIVLIPPNHTTNSELTRFWNSLATLAPDDQNILNFPICPVFFPKRMQSLYIRESYKDLYEIICKNLELPESESSARIAITGTPGIGKSVFLFYILWRLSRVETTETVVLHRQKDRGKIFVFKRHGCWATNNYDDVEQLLTKTTWYLTDTLSDPPAESIMATTILVSPPARKYYKEFLKYSDTAPLHYLPVWSLEELHLACQLYSMSQEYVEERYYLIGGIPRFVLEKKHDLIREIECAVGILNVNALGQIGNAIEKGIGTYDLVIHYDVDSTYTDQSLCMGSAYITEQAVERFINTQEQDLKRFLAKAEPLLYLATLHMNLFEGYAHRLLAAGGEFPIRSLNGKETDTFLQLKKREIRRFHNISECEDNDIYYVPKISSCSCIDSTIPKIGHFKMTISLDHPLSESKMMSIVKESQENKLYFVVPHTIYNNFPQQSLSSKKNKSGSAVNIKKKYLISSASSLNNVKKQKTAKDDKGVSLQALHQFALYINLE